MWSACCYHLGKTCNNRLPNAINVSASHKNVVPIQPVSGNIQIIFPSINFTCNGIINQIIGWYQIDETVDLDTNITVETFIRFQIWHPINDSHYKLVSETSLSSATDDLPRVADGLTLQFYSGSIVGFYIESIGYLLRSLTLLKSKNTPQSFLYVTNDKPCVFDISATGVLHFTTIDVEVVLDYGTYVHNN